MFARRQVFNKGISCFGLFGVQYAQNLAIDDYIVIVVRPPVAQYHIYPGAVKVNRNMNLQTRITWPCCLSS